MKDPSNAQLQIAALSSLMFYLSGRLDAADRRAEFATAIALAIIGFIVSDSPPVASHLLSLLFLLASVGLGLWAAKPRKFRSLSWVSQIFLGTPTEDIRNRMASSEKSVVAEMILGQQEIGALVRKKNLFAAWAMLALALGSTLFLVGL